MTDKIQSDKRALALLTLAVAFLVNPIVRVVDILPDFIACFIIAKYLSYPADRAPYFEEARLAFVKLGFISLAKMPAFLIIGYARSVNTMDNDTSTLFTFVFSVIEAVLLYTAVKNLFLGIYYLGQRSSAGSLIAPFAYTKKGNKAMSPERLELFAYVFVFIRCAATALPELLLLSRTTDTGANVHAFNPARYYPYTIVFVVFAVFVLSIIFAKRAVGYLRAVAAEGQFIPACDGLIGPEREEELKRKITAKSVRGSLTVLTVASFFTVELCFDNFNDVNLLPHFIYGAILLLALLSIKKHTEVAPAAYVLCGVFCAVAAANYILHINFLDSYGYEALVKSAEAKSAYIPIIIVSAAELAALCAVIAFIALTLVRVVKTHTGLCRGTGDEGKNFSEIPRKTKTNIYIWCAFAILSGVSKLADVILKYYSDLTLVATDDGIGNVVSGLVPWFGLVVLLFSALYIGYSMYLFSSIKDDVELKYS